MPNKNNPHVMKNMYFNRFLLFRYSLALFFFSNLFWLVSFIAAGSSYWLIPLVMLMVSVPAVYEQIKLNGNMQKEAVPLSATQLFFTVQTGLNAALILLSFTTFGMRELFFFMTDTTEARLFLIVLLMIGIVLCLFNLKRKNQINSQTDKMLQAILDFEKTKGRKNKK